MHNSLKSFGDQSLASSLGLFGFFNLHWLPLQKSVQQPWVHGTNSRIEMQDEGDCLHQPQSFPDVFKRQLKENNKEAPVILFYLLLSSNLPLLLMDFCQQPFLWWEFPLYSLKGNQCCFRESNNSFFTMAGGEEVIFSFVSMQITVS